MSRTSLIRSFERRGRKRGASGEGIHGLEGVGQERGEERESWGSGARGNGGWGVVERSSWMHGWIDGYQLRVGNCDSPSGTRAEPLRYKTSIGAKSRG